MEKYKNKGLTGLKNLGNTCFINSIIQCLLHTYELKEFLDDNDYKQKLSKTPDSKLLIEYDDLQKIMWSKNHIISPNKFLYEIQNISRIKKNELFTGYSQNDAIEFLTFLIECFHNGLSRKVNITIKGKIENEKDKLAKLCYERLKNMQEKEYSEIINIFYGIQVTQILDYQNSDNILSNTCDPFFMVNLPIPTNKKNITIYDCFDLHTAKEELIGENGWKNDDGVKMDIYKYLLYWNLPKILIIDLKRYNYTLRKNNSLIQFPLEELDLTKYVVGYNSNKYIYDCYGVCNHSGNNLGGHYTSFVKNQNGKWYLYNDTMVSEVKKNQVVSAKAYCLFYRLCEQK